MSEEEKGKTLEEQNAERLKQLQEAAEKDREKEVADLAEQLTIRDRLMRRLKAKTFKTVFEDDLGEFEIETRLMSSSERLKALKHNILMAQSEGNPEKYSEAIAGFKEIVREIVVTPGLEEFWDSDEVSDDVLIVLVLNAVYGSLSAVGDSVGSFRILREK